MTSGTKERLPECSPTRPVVPASANISNTCWVSMEITGNKSRLVDLQLPRRQRSLISSLLPAFANGLEDANGHHTGWPMIELFDAAT